MNKFILSFLAVSLLFSCKDDEKKDVDTGYKIPTTYNFDNVSFGGQTSRLDMLENITTYIKTGATVGTSLDAQQIKDMFANSGNPFNDLALDTSGKKLSNKCFILDTALFISYFDSLEIIAGTTGGSNGVAGIVTNGTKSYLCNAKGFEYAQLIDKGLMGAVFYYQACENYFTDAKIGDAVDNITVTPGKGTPREHHFDEAFGYFGVPTDFPSNTNGIRFWGKYCDGRDGMLNSNQLMMDAWLKGRAAISNNDKVAMDAAVVDIKALWEKISVGTALHYLNGAIDNINDDAERNHELSEAVAFIGALKYNSNAVITTVEIAQILAAIGDNFYEVSISDLNNAKTLLAGFYGFDAQKNQF
tara:strand:- start:209 stop:1285 length:1077 start_codon:yes stop_codon:yes gene_type:complete